MAALAADSLHLPFPGTRDHRLGLAQITAATAALITVVTNHMTLLNNKSGRKLSIAIIRNSTDMRHIYSALAVWARVSGIAVKPAVCSLSDPVVVSSMPASRFARSIPERTLLLLVA